MSTATAQALQQRRYSPLKHHITSLKMGLETFAQTLTSNFDLRLYYKGSNCFAARDARTGKFTIYLPELNLLERQSMTQEEVQEAEDFLQCLRGFVYHECGHVILTDYAVVKKTHDQIGGKFAFFFNLLEDLRIERTMSRKFRGAKEAIRFMNSFVEKENVANFTDPLSTKPNVFGQLILAMHEVGKKGLTGARAAPMWEHFSLKPRRFTARFEKHILEAKRSNSSEEVFEIALKLWNAMKLQEEQEKPEDEQDEKIMNEENAAEPGAPGDGQSAGGEGEEEREEADATNPNGKPQGDYEEEEQDEEPDYVGTQKLNLDEEPVPEDHVETETVLQRKLKSAVTKKLKEQQSKGQPHDYMIYTTEGDKITVPEIVSWHREEFKKMQDELQLYYGPVKRQLEARLRVRTESFEIGGLDEGDLDTTNLHRVAFGSKDIYKQRAEAPDLTDVCVALWFDTSGSMGYGNKLELAKMATIVFGSALNAIRIPFEVVSYSTSSPHVGESRHLHASAEERALYTRWGNLEIEVYKTFQENWQVVAPRVMDAHVRNNTFDGECIRMACQRLLSQRQKRKVLFVMNDGEPCPNVSYYMEHHQEYLKKVVAEAQGVEIVAIGIQAPEVARYYPKHVVVNTVSDLPKLMATELGKVLLGQ